MGLSRLDNFLKSTRGTILYVDPSSLDATDSIENQGNSLTRPFKTIQRALIESARFSYQRGLIMIGLVRLPFYFILASILLIIDLDSFHLEQINIIRETVVSRMTSLHLI